MYMVYHLVQLLEAHANFAKSKETPEYKNLPDYIEYEDYNAFHYRGKLKKRGERTHSALSNERKWVTITEDLVNPKQVSFPSNGTKTKLFKAILKELCLCVCELKS